MTSTVFQFSLSNSAVKWRRVRLFFYKQSMLMALVQFRSHDHFHASAPRQTIARFRL